MQSINRLALSANSGMIHGPMTPKGKIGKNVSIGHLCSIEACSISDDVIIGSGVVILQGAKIGKGAKVGPRVVVGKGASIGKLARIGAGAILEAGAKVSGETIIPAGTVVSGSKKAKDPQAAPKKPKKPT